MKFWSTFLKVKTEDRNILQIILWWELRRIPYNIIVLLCGITSILVMMAAAAGRVHLKPGEDFYEPIMIPTFGLFCNVGYTLGWLTEIFRKRNLTYGPKMFKIGLYFTLFWVFLPMTIWIIIALIDEIKKIF